MYIPQYPALARELTRKNFCGLQGFRIIQRQRALALTIVNLCKDKHIPAGLRLTTMRHARQFGTVNAPF
jgi:hypothetical protein